MTDPRVTTALAAAEEGMNLASDHADTRLRLAVDKAIAEAIASGEVWSANDIRDRLPVVCSGLVGARVDAARKRGEIRWVGEERSTLRSTRGKRIGKWVAA